MWRPIVCLAVAVLGSRAKGARGQVPYEAVAYEWADRFCISVLRLRFCFLCAFRVVARTQSLFCALWFRYHVDLLVIYLDKLFNFYLLVNF